MKKAYYIAKGHKTLGPCTLDDLRNFLAYGSIQHGDLVMIDGEEQWRPVATLLQETASHSLGSGTTSPLPRRRTVRYRDYERVPQAQQSGQVISWMTAGFLLFPPLLWRAAHTIYSDRIYSRRADENGYLILWPRWVEMLVTALIVLNGLLWLTLAALAWERTAPIFHELSQAFRESMNAMRDLF